MSFKTADFATYLPASVDKGLLEKYPFVTGSYGHFNYTTSTLYVHVLHASLANSNRNHLCLRFSLSFLNQQADFLGAKPMGASTLETNTGYSTKFC